MLHGEGDIGKKKVISAKESLSKINALTSIESIDVYLDEQYGLDLIQNCDVIIDATDNIETRQLIDRFSKESNIPMVYGGLYRWEGQVAVLNVNGSPGYNELFPEPTSGGDTCADAGVLALMPNIIRKLQAFHAVNFIKAIETTSVGKLLLYDGIHHSTQIIK